MMLYNSLKEEEKVVMLYNIKPKPKRKGTEGVGQRNYTDATSVRFREANKRVYLSDDKQRWRALDVERMKREARWRKYIQPSFSQGKNPIVMCKGENISIVNVGVAWFSMATNDIL